MSHDGVRWSEYDPQVSSVLGEAKACMAAEALGSNKLPPPPAEAMRTSKLNESDQEFIHDAREADDHNHQACAASSPPAGSDTSHVPSAFDILHNDSETIWEEEQEFIH